MKEDYDLDRLVEWLDAQVNPAKHAEDVGLTPVSARMILEYRDRVRSQPKGAATLVADRGELLCILELALIESAKMALRSRERKP